VLPTSPSARKARSPLASWGARLGAFLLDYLMLPYSLYVEGSLELAGSKPPLLLLLLPLQVLVFLHGKDKHKLKLTGALNKLYGLVVQTVL